MDGDLFSFNVRGKKEERKTTLKERERKKGWMLYSAMWVKRKDTKRTKLRENIWGKITKKKENKKKEKKIKEKKKEREIKEKAGSKASVARVKEGREKEWKI